MSEIATGKLVIWMRLQAKRIAPDGNSTSIMLSAAADRLEQQEQRIAELEAENREIRQNSVSHTTHAEFVSDYQEQLDEKDARIAELERIIDERKQKYAVLDTEAAEMRVRIYELERQIETDRAEWEPIWANRCDMQRKRVLDLERALAAVKVDAVPVVRGKWIPNQHWEYRNGNTTMSGDTGLGCSACGAVNFTGINQRTPFCPHCGARMAGES